ncbi:MAG: protein-L-isoaspartate(D-aspartate) O-methyltransferase [Bryobacteraceae bacterium]|nr:protein-L-isoaspartate(D-aspartate) O-methyltransferase [Bryobacteraceae bacterium]
MFDWSPSWWISEAPDWAQAARVRMVNEQIAARGVRDTRVLDAMKKVPRHLFVPPALERRAYDDSPLPIGQGQTISQPYIVGSMTDLLDASPGMKVLEIGTGSGYQAAILAEVGLRVFSIEIVPGLAAQARALLERLGYRQVTLRTGDGYAGWKEEAPFDRIIVTAAPPEVPQALVDQLKPGGKMVVPVGREYQELLVIDKGPDGKVKRRVEYPVMFVPMVKGR